MDSNTFASLKIRVSFWRLLIVITLNTINACLPYQWRFYRQKLKSRKLFLKNLIGIRCCHAPREDAISREEYLIIAQLGRLRSVKQIRTKKNGYVDHHRLIFLWTGPNYGIKYTTFYKNSIRENPKINGKGLYDLGPVGNFINNNSIRLLI